MQGLNFSVKKRRKAFLCLENVSVWVVYNHDNRIISNHITCYLNPVFHYKILSDSYHKQQANYRSSCSHYKNTKKIYVCEQIGNFCLEYIHVILYIYIYTHTFKFVFLLSEVWEDIHLKLEMQYLHYYGQVYRWMYLVIIILHTFYKICKQKFWVFVHFQIKL